MMKSNPLFSSICIVFSYFVSLFFYYLLIFLFVSLNYLQWHVFKGVNLQIKHLVASVSLIHLELILYYTVMDMEHTLKWLLKSFTRK